MANRIHHVPMGTETIDERYWAAAIVHPPLDRWKSRITHVHMPHTVTEIGDMAFAFMAELVEIVIPARVQRIGENAFVGCHSLVVVRLNRDLRSIGAWAFQSCRLLTTVVIPDGVDSIGPNAFNSCVALEAVSFGSSLREIGMEAFAKCISLKTIAIPDSVVDLQYGCFRGCTMLTTVSIGRRVPAIEYDAFKGCTSLVLVTIGPSVAHIGMRAFAGCSMLPTLLLPDNVRTLGPSSFKGCVSLRTVVMPARMVAIGASAFVDSTDLRLFLRPTLYGSDPDEPDGWKQNFIDAYAPGHAWLPTSIRIWAADEVIALIGGGPFAGITTRKRLAEKHQALPRAATWDAVERLLFGSAASTMAFATAVQRLYEKDPTFPQLPPNLHDRINYFVGGWFDPTLVVGPAAPPVGGLPDVDVYTMLLRIPKVSIEDARHAARCLISRFEDRCTTYSELLDDFNSADDDGSFVDDLVGLLGWGYAPLANQIEAYLNEPPDEREHFADWALDLA
jgi:hypothetical protein